MLTWDANMIASGTSPCNTQRSASEAAALAAAQIAGGTIGFMSVEIGVENVMEMRCNAK